MKLLSELKKSPHCRLESLRSVEGESLFKLVSIVLINTVSMKAEIWDFLIYSVKLCKENSNGLQITTERENDRTVSQPDEPEATGNEAGLVLSRQTVIA